MLQLCQVTNALFISNARSACSEQLLQQEAVTLCINVSKQQPFPSGGVAKLQIPVYDDPSEDLYSHFDRCADAIQKEAGRGGRSVVYCKNGRSRSATICIAYLMKHRGLTLADAIQRVKTARHVIDPNPGFLSQLQRYEAVLKARRGRS
ncbi:dual specificity phosphatase 28 [Cololabis saira]|uniref:dual specificity phosphatase 28 n=1 Tax=Cololabis saira TaxID=129043 RepID=UPI002AD4FBF9|nr:dual specificity phosphatase 28 [Cololabis saira]